MTDTETALWNKVRAMLGSQYLANADPGRLQQFQQLLLLTTRGGRDAEGPVREVLGLLGDRWSTLLLHLLHFGPLRFNVLQRIVAEVQDTGISRRMLSLKLRALERDGLALRVVSPTTPVRVEYSLTPLGEGLWQMASQLVDWLDRNAGAIGAARAVFEQQDHSDSEEGDEE